MEIRNEEEFTVVEMPPKLDVNTSPEVERVLLELLAADTMRIACDFSKVHYISSAGLRVMLVVSKKLKAAKGEFVILSIHPQTFEPFRLAGFDKIMTFKNTLSST